MKIETPQILWHNDSDNGKNAPLYSMSMLESGICEDLKYGHVLATAGNTSEINIWKVSFRSDERASTKRILQHSSPNNKIEHMLSLARHERSVNTIAFSPDGLHLATAGDSGSIIVWSVPPSKRGNQNGRHFWSTVTKEQDLTCRIVSSSCEGICDLSWSADSKRFVAGSIDHCVMVYEDTNYDVNHNPSDDNRKPQVESQWQSVYRNSRDHTHFVQGVAYDPLGVYVASMGSDRTVRVYARKPPPKAKRKVGRQNASSTLPPPAHKAMVEQILADSKLDLGKAKTLKYRQTVVTDETVPPPKKQYLFADESTVESFFRRLSWTADGAFLVTPAALWHNDALAEETSESSSPSFATYVFARHRYDRPYKVLPGLEKPSVVIRPCPVLFLLPESANAPMENQKMGLPYRSVFAVLTLDSVLIYDTHHTRPLCIARGLHYAGLTDCTWSADGRNLLVSSTDGYVSILSFAPGELGQVYTKPEVIVSLSPAEPTVPSTKVLESPSTPETPKLLATPIAPETPKLLASASIEETPTLLVSPSTEETSNLLPSCGLGKVVTSDAPPAKRAKTRITPTLISSCLAPAAVATVVQIAPPQPTQKEDNPPQKQKKRIQPTLVSVLP